MPGQEQLDQGGALRSLPCAQRRVVGEGAYAAEYDQNGNMTSRVVAGQAQLLEWDAENRLVGITQGTSVSTYVYDGDGNRVQATVDGVTTVYIGGYYEETAGTVRTYYYHGDQRVAMRENGALTWLLGDHLGSTNVAYRASDGQTATQRYYAWGGIRPGPENELPTDYTFTGQRLDAQTNLYHMGARWYDPASGRWLSPDSIVPDPGDPQSLNRFSYANNSPVALVDPTGQACEAGAGVGGGSDIELYLAYEAAKSRVDAAAVGSYVYGHLVEHLSYVALYHLDIATKPPTHPDIQDHLESSYRTSSRVAINGAYGAKAAVSEAYTAAGGEAAAGLGLATSLYNLVCPPVWSFGSIGSPKPYYDRHGNLTNGRYTVDAVGMEAHKKGSLAAGKSQFLSMVDAEEAVLDAAICADENNLWVKHGDAWQATVRVKNGPVGVLGHSGELTDWLTVTRTRSGFIHGWPSGQ